MYQFFVSFANNDYPWARWIATTLNNAGYEVCFDRWQVKPGDDFIKKMQQSLRESQCLIAVLTPEYEHAHFAMWEFDAASSDKKKVIPVRVQDFVPKALFGPLHRIDLVGLDEKAAEERLLSGVRETGPELGGVPFPGNASHPEIASQDASRFPGLRPRVWNLTAPPNPRFTGRESLLASIRQGLLDHKIVVLHGAPGVGKSELALEFVYRNISSYDVVWWIRGDVEQNLLQDLAAMSKPIGGPAELPLQDAAQAVINSLLLGPDRWLLVLDDAGSIDYLRTFSRISERGHLLVTSRLSDWGEGRKTMHVEALTDSESLDFLTRSSPGAGSEPDARDVAKELGGLPIALEGAVAYVKAHGASWSKYLTVLEEYQKRQGVTPEDIREIFPRHDDQARDFYASWKLNCDAVAQVCPAAIDFLKLHSFFSADPLPVAYFSDYQELLPDSLKNALAGPSGIETVRDALIRHSLVDSGTRGPQLSVGKLVQLVARTLISSDRENAILAACAVRLVNRSFPYLEYAEDFEEWTTCALLLPHAQAAVGRALKLITQDPRTQAEASDLLTKCGLYLLDIGEANEALAIFERVLAIDSMGTDVRAGERPDFFRAARLARDHNNLGWAKKDAGDLQGAKHSFSEALSLNIEALGPDDPTVATTCHNLGWALMDLGEREAAQKEFSKARDIDEANFGTGAINVARDWMDLSLVQLSSRQLTDAEESARKALAIHEAAHALLVVDKGAFPYSKGDHGQEKKRKRLCRDLAKDYAHLGEISKAQGRIENAREFFQRALSIDEGILGAENPTVARHHRHLGLTLKDGGDLEGARKAFEDALKIDEKAFGSEGRNLAEDHIQLALVFKAMNNLGLAKRHAERALAIDRGHTRSQYGTSTGGPLGSPGNVVGDAKVARDLIHLGWILKDCADLDGAIGKFEEAMEVLEQVGGGSDTARARAEALAGLGWSEKDKAQIEREQGKQDQAKRLLESAENHLQEALAFQRQSSGGTDDLAVSNRWVELGWIRKELGRSDEAIRCFENALHIGGKGLLPCQDFTPKILEGLVSALEDRAILEAGGAERGGSGA